nr:hypothetical protein [Tanacetum cinerariifolium]
MNPDDNTLGLAPELQKTFDHNRLELENQDHDNEPSSSNYLFEEYFTAGNQSVLKSFDLSDNSQQQDTKPTLNVQPTTEPIIQPTIANAEENNTDQTADAQFEPYEFINPFCTPIQGVVKSSSHNVDTLNMHTFYQRHRFDYHWTKDHPLEQVPGNPSKPVQTRKQLATDPEMCMFALTVSTAEPTNSKEAMADHAWIKLMQEEFHHFNRLKVWELVDKPFGKTVINLKLLWKNKKDEDNIDFRSTNPHKISLSTRPGSYGFACLFGSVLVFGYWIFVFIEITFVDAFPNASEMWKEIKRLKQGESINVQDLKTNLFWEFGKFTSLDGESLESYYLRFYKLMNELTRNQCKVTNHQVNVQFLLQLQPEWQRTPQSKRINLLPGKEKKWLSTLKTNGSAPELS